MALSVFDRPIPGQSLTDQPKNYPWERPPESSDPEEVLRFYVDKLEDPDMLDNILTVLEESNMTLTGLVKGLMRTGVSAGRHSIDVGLIVAPAVHEYIKSVADAVGATYEEGLPERGRNKEAEQKRAALKARDMLSGIGVTLADEVPQKDIPEVTEEIAQDEPVMEEEAPKGLMARRSM